MWSKAKLMEGVAEDLVQDISSLMYWKELLNIREKTCRSKKKQDLTLSDGKLKSGENEGVLRRLI